MKLNLHKINIKLPTVIIAMAIIVIGCSASNNDRDLLVERSTENVRIYQDGDFIEYTFTGTYSNTQLLDPDGNPATDDFSLVGLDTCSAETTTVVKNIVGTIRVEWGATSTLAEPLMGAGTVDVILQTVTLNFSNVDTPGDTFGGQFSFPIIVSSYVSQSATGAISLRAFDDSASAVQYLWVSTDTQLDSVVSPVVFPSPVPKVGAVELDYYVNAGCDIDTSCTEAIRHFDTGNVTYLGESIDGLLSVEYTYLGDTIIDDYNPLGYSIRSNIIDTSSTVSNNDLFEAMGFCRLQTTPTDTDAAKYTEITRYSNTAWTMPEFGVLQASNICTHDVGVQIITDDPSFTGTDDGCRIAQPLIEGLPQTWNFDEILISSTNITPPE